MPVELEKCFGNLDKTIVCPERPVSVTVCNGVTFFLSPDVKNSIIDLKFCVSSSTNRGKINFSMMFHHHHGSKNDTKMVKRLSRRWANETLALNGRDCGGDNKGGGEEREGGERERERERETEGERGDIYLAEGNTHSSRLSLPSCALCALSTTSPLHSDFAGLL